MTDNKRPFTIIKNDDDLGPMSQPQKFIKTTTSDLP